ncbi:MAG TPA: hypothetical protein VNS22_15595 [Geminicoccus sp.]|nr:hypothetical protein [Geminicoccus sp.]HWL69793.1 hypothetical protein [Geminicoccus sp.]
MGWAPYREWHVVCRSKENRRIASRCDKWAASHLAFLQRVTSRKRRPERL